MKLYNTQTKKKEEIKGKQVKMYVCGPTVYDRAHIGNLRTYINVDLLKRSLGYLGYKTKHVMNITDIEDKIIKRSQEEGVDYHKITSEYEKLFWKDLGKLDIKRPDMAPHATDDKVIKEMVKIIEKLMRDGVAYKSEDGSVYFSIDKFGDYGKLSHLNRKGLRASARCAADEYGKESAADFALWKAARGNEPSWNGPKGIKGRPGWHIECSAMGMLYLGETIDIHAGGVDLVFPHHENEVAQSEAYTGKPFVKHWFHGEHLLVEGKRMGKSENNFYSIDDMSKKYNVEPLAFRMLCLQSHYRDKLNFTSRSIKDAQNSLNNLRNFVNRIAQSNGKSQGTAVEKNIKVAEKSFREALSDDLNTPKAMAAVFNFVGEVNKLPEINNKDAKAILKFLESIDNVLALNLKPEIIDSKVENLFDEYLEAKAKRDYEKSDKLRIKLDNLGWIAEDYHGASRLRKK
ncbi:MAG: cysteine--tRNA ligase [Patescibacteria group bacterium]|nr:cysteine--tRNA ligase [Patescibacteria group bacterium]